MIVDTSFTRAWIQAKRKAHKGADPGLIEKQIYAFELLHRLVESGKQFVFKGGTSLHLILSDHKRLSTDLDVVGAFALDELSGLIAKSRFSRVEENIRKKSNIPKRHFKFYYSSALDGRETSILLDTLEQSHTFPKLERRSITSSLFETDEETTVYTPSLEGMLGDKLTVFAPHTIGIRFGAGKSMEIIKQLFDIGELFDRCKDLKTMIEAYQATQAQESEYRTPKHSRDASLQDTIRASFLVSQYLLKGYESNVETAEIAIGLKQIENHLLGVPFRIDQARVAASKIALLASIVRKGDSAFSLEQMRYDSSRNEKLLTVELSGPFEILNRLKKLQQMEAFHYWVRVSQMEQGGER
ncbi:MAG: nucleotidyl transferase AbiEii/AbiGii toxin family protein, partial [Bacteroidota bacterium]